MKEFPKYLTKGGERDALHAIAEDAKHEAELAKSGYARVGGKPAKPAKKVQKAD